MKVQKHLPVSPEMDGIPAKQQLINDSLEGWV